MARLAEVLSAPPWTEPDAASPTWSGSGLAAPPPARARVVMQIHDELLLEVESSLVDELAEAVKQAMEQAAVLEVPLAVRVKVGATWGDLEE